MAPYPSETWPYKLVLSVAAAGAVLFGVIAAFKGWW